MRNPDRLIDRTYLSLEGALERGLHHRDYGAHFFRWTHVAKYLNQKHRYQNSVVLDVGCGRELPLAKLLYVNKMCPLYYVGVDANKTHIPGMLQDKKIPIKLWFDTDFCDLEVQHVSKVDEPSDKYVKPNVLVCFEVLEHVTPVHCRRMLQHMQEVTSNDCNYFISTPCYNGSAAENHVGEATFSALGALLEDLDFNIDGVWGTFASIRDYESELTNLTVAYDGKSSAPMNVLPMFEALSNYYDTNVLAIIFAPLFPAKSRNCLWHLTKGNKFRRFAALKDTPGPWSQHPNWRDLAG